MTSRASRRRYQSSVRPVGLFLLILLLLKLFIAPSYYEPERLGITKSIIKNEFKKLNGIKVSVKVISLQTTLKTVSSVFLERVGQAF